MGDAGLCRIYAARASRRRDGAPERGLTRVSCVDVKSRVSPASMLRRAPVSRPSPDGAPLRRRDSAPRRPAEGHDSEPAQQGAARPSRVTWSRTALTPCTRGPTAPPRVSRLHAPVYLNLSADRLLAFRRHLPIGAPPSLPVSLVYPKARPRSCCRVAPCVSCGRAVCLLRPRRVSPAAVPNRASSIAEGRARPDIRIRSRGARCASPARRSARKTEARKALVRAEEGRRQEGAGSPPAPQLES